MLFYLNYLGKQAIADHWAVGQRSLFLQMKTKHRLLKGVSAREKQREGENKVVH